MKNKRLLTALSLLLMVGLLIGVFGCAQQAAPAPAPGPAPTTTVTKTVTATPTPTPAKPTPPAQPILIRFTHEAGTTEDSGWHMWISKFTERLDEEFPGWFKVQEYPLGQLYAGIPGVKACMEGAVEVAWWTGGYAPAILPKEDAAPFSIVALPMYKSAKGAYEVAERVVAAQIAPRHMEPYGLIYRGHFAGPVTYCSRKPTEKLEDFRGLKFRSPPIAIYEAVYDAMGIVKLTIAMSEVTPSLQSGAVEGSLSEIRAMYQYGWHKIAPYIVNFAGCGFHWAEMAWVWNKDFWDGLPAFIREKLDTEIIPDVDNWMAVTQVEPFATGWPDMFRADGATVYVWEPEEYEELTARLEPIIDKFAPSIGEEYVKQAREILSKY